MEKWKRRETNLESVRHEALVETQLLKARLDDQKAATQSAISVAKVTKETLSNEINRLRKQLTTKNEKEIHKIDQERQRLEREVSRLKNEIQRVRDHTKSHVAAAAAAAATAAFDGAKAGGGKGNSSTAAPAAKVVPSFNKSSKERVAIAELKAKTTLDENKQLIEDIKEMEIQLKNAKKETTTSTSYLKKKVQELQNEIELLHRKLQERKNELTEAKNFNREQEQKWRDVQQDINEDTKKRRELGILITNTEQKARETQYLLKRSEENLVNEKDSHQKTIDSLNETVEKFTKLKSAHQAMKLNVEELTITKNKADKEQLNVLKEMQEMQAEVNKMKKETKLWEETSQEQKELLQDATKSIKGYVFLFSFYSPSLQFHNPPPPPLLPPPPSPLLFVWIFIHHTQIGSSNQKITISTS
jgi:chromosome segregation ATPase